MADSGKLNRGGYNNTEEGVDLKLDIQTAHMCYGQVSHILTI